MCMVCMCMVSRLFVLLSAHAKAYKYCIVLMPVQCMQIGICLPMTMPSMLQAPTRSPTPAPVSRCRKSMLMHTLTATATQSSIRLRIHIHKHIYIYIYTHVDACTNKSSDSLTNFGALCPYIHACNFSNCLLPTCSNRQIDTHITCICNACICMYASVCIYVCVCM